MVDSSNKRGTPPNQRFVKRSYADYLRVRTDTNLISEDSAGKSIFQGVVVGIVLEPSEVNPKNVTIAGYNIATDSSFTPASVPYGYVVNVPEKGYICSGEMPNPNDAQYRNYISNLVTSGFVFKVRPGQSFDLANVGDIVLVKFNGPNFSSDGHYVGNVSAARGAVSYPPNAGPAHVGGTQIYDVSRTLEGYETAFLGLPFPPGTPACNPSEYRTSLINGIEGPLRKGMAKKIGGVKCAGPGFGLEGDEAVEQRKTNALYIFDALMNEGWSATGAFAATWHAKMESGWNWCALNRGDGGLGLWQWTPGENLGGGSKASSRRKKEDCFYKGENWHDRIGNGAKMFDYNKPKERPPSVKVAPGKWYDASDPDTQLALQLSMWRKYLRRPNSTMGRICEAMKRDDMTPAQAYVLFYNSFFGGGINCVWNKGGKKSTARERMPKRIAQAADAFGVCWTGTKSQQIPANPDGRPSTSGAAVS